MTEKLHKVLADLGVGSRREMERWIADGRVVVDGKVAKLGDRVGAREEIRVDGRNLRLSNNKPELKRVRTIIYNKPEGEICSRNDPEGRPSVFDRLPRLHAERWISVGRLDFNTSGLLIFTTDGALANKLMHPSSNVMREYVCRVMAAEVTEDTLKALMEGVELDDGIAKFEAIAPMRGEGINRWYNVCLAEGRNREVRRLWESQGIMVNRLKRVRYGSVSMPSFLDAGQWLDLTPKELKLIYKSVDLKPTGSLNWLPADKIRYERQVARLRRGGKK